MNEKKFRKVLNYARKNNQEVIIVYVNNTAFKDLHESIKNGNEVYQNAIKKCEENQVKNTVFSRSVYDDMLVAFVCIPVKKLLKSSEYVKEILIYFDKHLIEGPVVLYPSNVIITT